MLPPRLETFAQLSRTEQSLPSSPPNEWWNESWSVLDTRVERRERPNFELELVPPIFPRRSQTLRQPSVTRRVHHPPDKLVSPSGK